MNISVNVQKTFDLTDLTAEEFGLLTALVGETYGGFSSELYDRMSDIASDEGVPYDSSDYPETISP